MDDHARRVGGAVLGQRDGIALRSGHFVQSSADGQPNVVIIAAVLAAVHAARTDTHLPSCLRLLHGTGVQCRA